MYVQVVYVLRSVSTDTFLYRCKVYAEYYYTCIQVIYTMRVRAGNRIYKSMNMRGTAHLLGFHEEPACGYLTVEVKRTEPLLM